MVSCQDVANYFLTLVDEESGDCISNLKMQKLVYYAQGFHLALTGEKLFSEDIEAWRHGPVVPSLYHTYKQHGAGAIPQPEAVDVSMFSQDQRELLDEVYQVYGQFSAWKLRDLTHEEPPWKDADARGNVFIDPVAMRDFFKTRLTQ